MTQKWYNNLLGFSLFGMAMWFFGNLYEAVVVGPNMLTDTSNRMKAWQDFFVDTNPVMYYVPLTVIAALLVIILMIKTPNEAIRLRTLLQIASVFTILGLLAGTYMIVALNFKVFFGGGDRQANLRSMCLQWNVINVFRTCFAGISLFELLQAYVIVKRSGLPYMR